jgi:hypothetical protein
MIVCLWLAFGLYLHECRVVLSMLIVLEMLWFDGIGSTDLSFHGRSIKLQGEFFSQRYCGRF